MLLHRAGTAQRAGDVERVGEQAEDPGGDPQRGRRPPGEGQGEGEEGEEEEQVALQGRPVDPELQPLLPLAPVEVGEQPDQPHRQGREQEGGADDRTDRDVVGALLGADQGDDRDQRLRHRGADRGQQAADRALAELQAVPDPLDRVGEEQRAGEDDGEAGEEQDGFHRRSLWEAI